MPYVPCIWFYFYIVYVKILPGIKFSIQLQSINNPQHIFSETGYSSFQFRLKFLHFLSLNFADFHLIYPIVNP